MIEMGDLKLNMDLRAGEIKCHRLVDLVLTPDGDLALTQSDHEMGQQTMLVYFATPKGEMIDPDEGSVFFDYMHKPLTKNRMASLSVELRAELGEFFPELGVYRVTLTQTDHRRVFLTVHCSVGALTYLFSPEDVLHLNMQLAQTRESLRWGVDDVMPGGVY